MKYSNEEKLSIITRYQQGESAIALSNELAIPRSTLYRWFNSFPTDSSGKPLKFSYQEYALLQRKVEKLQNIIIILKSVDCLASAPLKDRLHALEPFYGKYEVHTICEALDVDRGTFYNHTRGLQKISCTMYFMSEQRETSILIWSYENCLAKLRLEIEKTFRE